MADKKSDWKPEFDDTALKELIRATIKAGGPIDPAMLPSRVRERLKGRATGSLDIDAYIKEVLAETAKNS